MRVDADGDRVVKTAETDGERMRLRREATALRACAHPGVVPLVSVEGGDPPARLVMARMPGGTLGRVQAPFEVMAGVVAALAVTVADLHDIGWTHGAISEEHVLLDDRGGPVLTGFGESSRPASLAALAAGAAQDVADLAALLRPALPARADRKLVRLLAPAGERRRFSRPLPARQLAARIVGLVPAARLEPIGDAAQAAGDGGGRAGCASPAGPAGCISPTGPSGLADPAAARRLRGRAGAIAGLAALAGTGLIVAALHHAGPAASAPRPVDPPAPLASPLQPAGRYLLADPAGGRLVTVTGRWDCGAPRPAVLDPGAGWVWMFDSWPDPGRSVAARPVAHLAGASGLAVQEIRAGCDQLVVLARSGGRYVVGRQPARVVSP